MTILANAITQAVTAFIAIALVSAAAAIGWGVWWLVRFVRQARKP